MNGLVSIIIPAFNAGEYLKFCVESLKSQTYSKLEIIIVDDGSSKEDAEICDFISKTDNRIRVFHKKNGGVSSARNFGLKMIKGDYVMFVDADDWLDSGALQSQVNLIENLQTDAVFAASFFKDEKDLVQQLPYCKSIILNRDDVICKQLSGQFIASPCLSLMKTGLVVDCLFNESLSAYEDWEYNFRALLCLNSVAINPIPFYHYRTVEGSASKTSLNRKHITALQIPSMVYKVISAENLPYRKQASAVKPMLLYHLLVILANGIYTSEYAALIKKAAREKIGVSLFSRYVCKRHKLYIILSAISPKLFCIVYHIKYRRSKNER